MCGNASRHNLTIWAEASLEDKDTYKNQIIIIIIIIAIILILEQKQTVPERKRKHVRLKFH